MKPQWLTWFIFGHDKDFVPRLEAHLTIVFCYILSKSTVLFKHITCTIWRANTLNYWPTSLISPISFHIKWNVNPINILITNGYLWWMQRGRPMEVEPTGNQGLIFSDGDCQNNLLRQFLIITPGAEETYHMCTFWNIRIQTN